MSVAVFFPTQGKGVLRAQEAIDDRLASHADVKHIVVVFCDEASGAKRRTPIFANSKIRRRYSRERTFRGSGLTT